MPRRKGDVAAPPEVRFQKYLEAQEDGCVYWTGYIMPNGYGLFWNGLRKVYPHRWLYIFLNGEIPEGFEIEHSCHTESDCREGNNCKHRRCVNAMHIDAYHCRDPRREYELPEGTPWKTRIVD